MPVYTVSELYDLSRTIAAPLFGGAEYPWQVLAGIGDFILRLGPALPAGRFEARGEGVWIAKSARIAPSAFIGGPCIIDEDAEVRHCAFIRGGVLVGKNCVVGNSTEVKNAVLFDAVQVPHFNYVGDSVLGFRAHFGAGVITTNIKSDRTLVAVRGGGQKIETGLKKIGTMAGDGAEVGCNSALAPGCILGQNTVVYPCSHVRGQLPANHIFKSQTEIVPRR